MKGTVYYKVNGKPHTISGNSYGFPEKTYRQSDFGYEFFKKFHFIKIMLLSILHNGHEIKFPNDIALRVLCMMSDSNILIAAFR
ncbi:MAG: hypothetical protein ACTXOO_00085 [Sodalis sp. (in: enterobacteria)]